jgi:hypothetical protein
LQLILAQKWLDCWFEHLVLQVTTAIDKLLNSLSGNDCPDFLKALQGKAKRSGSQVFQVSSAICTFAKQFLGKWWERGFNFHKSLLVG